MKSAQASQIFSYVLALVILALVFIFGYKAISGMQERTDEAAFIQFQSDLKNNVETTMNYGDEKYDEIDVPGDYNKVCFIGLHAAAGSVTDPIIKDHIESSLKENVFLIEQQLALPKPIYIGVIDVVDDGTDGASDGVLCIDVTNNDVKVKFKGLGNYTELSQG